MKPKTYKFDALLEIDWLDIVDESAWLTPMAAMHVKPVHCRTAGYFLNRSEIVIRVSASMQVDDGDRGVTVIPWGCITKITQY